MSEGPTISDVTAAVQATNDVLRQAVTGGATQKDLDKAAQNEQETIAAYLEAEHGAAQAEAQAAGGGEAEAG